MGSFLCDRNANIKHKMLELLNEDIRTDTLGPYPREVSDRPAAVRPRLAHGSYRQIPAQSASEAYSSPGRVGGIMRRPRLPFGLVARARGIRTWIAPSPAAPTGSAREVP